MKKTKNTGEKLLIAATVLGASYGILRAVANQKNKKNEELNKDNQYLKAEEVKAVPEKKNFYEKHGKKAIDSALSFCGLAALAPVYGVLAAAIYIDDPGPVLFTQKRVGENKKFFSLHKFRSMKMSTPHDTPTHLLDNPDQYITRVGRILRKYSLDELPQIWDIFAGNMSIIGPRPALWNQDDLVAERDLYGANDVVPGLTGWAQINGRDELEIPVKAKFDGDYVKALKESSLSGFKMDVKCFFGTITSVLKHEGVVEGGTGEMHKQESETVYKNLPDHDTKSNGFKKVMIVGKNSYIGESIREYLEQYPGSYSVSMLDSMGLEPKPEMFEGYDVVINTAGIAHIKETEENRNLYYEVNRDLAVAIAKASKDAGVKQFIQFSTMSVYGKVTGKLNKSSPLDPQTNYGKSKAEADALINELADESFKVVTLRPPMVYGKNCKGNYQALRNFVMKTPVFPVVKNNRSMIYIGNLCEFIKRLIDTESEGLYCPQNRQYIRTSDIVEEVAIANDKKVLFTSLFNPAIKAAPSEQVKKVFGDLTYEKEDVVSKYNFIQSILETEKNENSKGSSNHLRLEHLIKHNPLVQSTYRYTMSAAFTALGKLIPTDENLVLFNGHGYKYNDSPRVIFEKMREMGLTEKYRVVWALNDPDAYEIEGCEKVKMDTPQYFLTALKAKYWVSCVNIERGLQFKKKDQVYLNTWHGAAINVCGNGVPGRNDFHWNYIDYFCSCGKYDEECFGRDLEVRQDAFLKCGYPRNDELYHVTEEDVKSLREKLGIPEGKKAILYAPTWRESSDGGSSYELAPPIDWQKWKEQLGDQYVVMLRTHPYTTKLMNVQFDDFVMNFTDYPRVNDLMIAADVLISDYSSINLDYSILGKPMICFGYDYDAYRRERGFYYDLEKEMPNGVMRHEDEVIDHLLHLDVEADSRKTEKFRDDHMQYGGNAAEVCIEKLFGERK